MAKLSDPLVRQLLEGRYVASLATKSPDGSIHMVAVWYKFDGNNIYVTTSSRSRKARNVSSDPSVSLMIDSRDPSASFGVTVAGTAQVLSGEPSRARAIEIHRKYMSDAALADPKVGPVFAAWDDVTLQIIPAAVISWDMRDLDKHVLGSSMERNPGYLLPLER